MVRGVTQTIVDESARGQAFSNLKAVHGQTARIEARFVAAREEYLAAAEELTAHGARYDQRANELEDLEGGHLIDQHHFRRPAVASLEG